MPTSTEFVTLCQAQVSLVASLGASLSIVYLAEDWVEGGDRKLIPVAAYPETTRDWQDSLALMPFGLDAEDGFAPRPRLLSPTSSNRSAPLPVVEIESEENFEIPSSQPPPEEQPSEELQFVLPLMRDGVVMGFLVTSREDRPWTSQEQHQIQAIAHTLTVACILDRRSRWFQQQFTQQQQIQAQQYSTLHSLLHQLKSPLTAVRTFGKLLIKRLLPEDKNHKIADGILRESDRLKELLQQVDQTLAFGEEKLHLPPATDPNLIPDSGGIDLEDTHLPGDTSPGTRKTAQVLMPAAQPPEPTSVKAVLEPLMASAGAIAEERHLNCIAEIPPQLPPVRANAKALREVLSNIIDNALKYTPPQGCIYIRVRRLKTASKRPNSSPEQLAIAISDTGPGIPEQDLKRLFQRGYRGIQAESDIPGTGLGLAIAAELIAEMQGNIQVFSPLNPEWIPPNLSGLSRWGSGTTFVVWLQLWG